MTQVLPQLHQTERENQTCPRTAHCRAYNNNRHPSGTSPSLPAGFAPSHTHTHTHARVLLQAVVRALKAKRGPRRRPTATTTRSDNGSSNQGGSDTSGGTQKDDPASLARASADEAETILAGLREGLVLRDQVVAAAEAGELHRGTDKEHDFFGGGTATRAKFCEVGMKLGGGGGRANSVLACVQSLGRFSVTTHPFEALTGVTIRALCPPEGNTDKSARFTQGALSICPHPPFQPLVAMYSATYLLVGLNVPL